MSETYLITGATGTFGTACFRHILSVFPHSFVRLFSRDELKQAYLKSSLTIEDMQRTSFLLGDVRDLDRLRLAFRGVTKVIHAAALKHVPSGEYNPLEIINTNITGTANIIRACLDAGIQQAVLLSSDKCVEPINIYGASKMVAERLFIQANNYGPCRFSVVRYGNVMGSRGSVVEIFNERIRLNQVLPITHDDMTRFFLRIEDAVELVMQALDMRLRGYILVPHLPAFRMTDLVRAMLGLPADSRLDGLISHIGARPGEKLHESLMTADEAKNMLVAPDPAAPVCIAPHLADWSIEAPYGYAPPIPETRHLFSAYNSGTWPYRLGVDELRERLRAGSVIY